MKILYLHGLDAVPNADKIALLEGFGNEVIAPTLDYRAGEVFEDIVAIAKREKVDAVVGSSMGGHIARHVADAVRVPALLLNPAVDTPNVQQFQPIAEARVVEPRKMLMVGQLDEPGRKLACYKFGRSNRHYDIKLLQEVTHQFDVATLKRMFLYFLEAYFPDKHERYADLAR